MQEDNLLLGAGSAVIVSALKGIPWVRRHPKAAAMILAAGVAAARVASGEGAGVVSLLLGVLAQVAASIGTHETILKPARDFVAAELEDREGDDEP